MHAPYIGRDRYLEQVAPEISAPLNRYVKLLPRGSHRKFDFKLLSDPKWIHLDGGPAQPFQDDDLPLLNDLYDSGIAFTDAQLGRLFKQLKKLDLENKTLVVLTSDHGEMLGEHGMFDHGQLQEEVLLVPLVFAYPGHLKGGLTVTTQVRTVDIAPTILELIGLRLEHSIDGVSLKPLMDGDASFSPPEAWTYVPESNYGLSLRINNELKYMLNDSALASSVGAQQLYRLQEDPEEEHNLAATVDDIANLKAFAQARLAERHGLRIRFSNASAAVFSGKLKGPLVDTKNLRSADMPCRCIERDGTNGALFFVPPMTTFTLVLENIKGGELFIEGSVNESEGAAPLTFTESLIPEGMEGSWAMELTGAEWRRVASGESEPSTGVRVWWHGRVSSVSELSPSDVDPELLRQMKALGYVH